MRNIASFDVGGTFIKYGVISEEGNILVKGKFETPSNNCKEEIPVVIIQRVKELESSCCIDAVGISTAGQIDTEKGEIIFASDNLPGYTGAKLSEEIMDKLGLRCFVENDVNCAALGELWKGAGEGKKSFVCIALGTGVGGAIIIDGKLYKGIGGSAGEIGHSIIDIHGEPCACGSNGCYERFASTSALIRRYSERSNIEVEKLSGELIVSKAKAGEELASEVYDEFLDNIVVGLVNVTHILDPGLIILGGGISAQGKPFFDEINLRFRKKVMKYYSGYTEIVQAKLENDAAIIGAAYNAFGNMTKICRLES
ncbi:ROK family protein [Clostridium oryzae]|uniref:Glucokinase n=1 Tax=Clostridium oryzae TaxID=1450648 RepID=A0A1V4IXT4_9CLOT|nr:ROK family protein [Clostridium oryzae]OPJ64585.1 glucokinase [Clostridium oryzae]